MKLAPRLTATQLFDVWSTSVDAVGSVRDSRGMTQTQAEATVAVILATKHGGHVAVEGVAYFRRLMLDCQRLSAGDMPEKER